jgi:outer membrane receptor protein involved in Fe transport
MERNGVVRKLMRGPQRYTGSRASIASRRMGRWMRCEGGSRDKRGTKMGDLMSKRIVSSAHLRAFLLAGTACGALTSGTGGAAAQSADASAAPVEKVTVTGTRIPRKNYTSNSPIVTTTGAETVQNADVTLDTFMNTLPLVVPSATTTSNNPGTNPPGQSRIDLRGLGSNRNIVLIDGRRAPVSTRALQVDLNTIPQILIDRIEVVSGGAGAVYGADAVSGAVNIILKKNFEGVAATASYSNSTEFWDAKEAQVSAAVGGNFDDGRGNAVIAFERSNREGLIKSQRSFAKFATSTTTFLPEGRYFTGGNTPAEAVYDAVFASYGFADPAGQSVTSGVGFNLDGTMFGVGVFNSPEDVVNFKYAIDDAVNARIFPDVYSYNFDAVNILTLPLDRDTFMARAHYDIAGGVRAYAQAQYTEYNSISALAPTPVPTVILAAPGEAATGQATSTLIESGQTVNRLLVVPVTNPFFQALAIPGAGNDFTDVIASRVGDNPALVGSGATEPFLMRHRTLDAGLRETIAENQIVSYLFGVQGPIGSTSWEWDTHVFQGKTEIENTQNGNIDTDRLQQLLEAPDGGNALCAGGFNPFGRQPLSAACVAFLEVATSVRTDIDMSVAQATLNGELFNLHAGPVEVVVGGEYRSYEINFDPGTATGPISGFNTQARTSGLSEFRDIFTEVLVPLARDMPLAQQLELGLGYRYSLSQFEDKILQITSEQKGSEAYKAELSWALDDAVRARGTYQHSVRAPNLGELFAGGGSAPQYFDPCSATTAAFAAGGAPFAALCAATGVAAPGVFVQTPGNQLGISLAGNTNLDPEQADTYTVGIVVASPETEGLFRNLRGSVDWWQIDVKDAIVGHDPNEVVADCYNYYGNNPALSAAHPSCQAIVRAGGDILFLTGPVGGYFASVNGARIKTSGVDVQIGWRADLEDLGGEPNWGAIDLSVYGTYLIEFKLKNAPGFPLADYAGTANFFGSGLDIGQSYPELKVNTQLRYAVDDYMFDVRARYIDSMTNRMGVIFPGEDASFTGAQSVWYWDVAFGWQVHENAQFRIGLNNAFDEQPPQYDPNVQSGTDPSLYDVIGRRVFTQLNFKF